MSPIEFHHDNLVWRVVVNSQMFNFINKILWCGYVLLMHLKLTMMCSLACAHNGNNLCNYCHSKIELKDLVYCGFVSALSSPALHQSRGRQKNRKVPDIFRSKLAKSTESCTDRLDPQVQHLEQVVST